MLLVTSLKLNVKTGVLTCIHVVPRLQEEKEAAERESREKETKILNLQRELEEQHDKLEAVERQKISQQRELEDLYSTKDDVGKSVSVWWI